MAGEQKAPQGDRVEEFLDDMSTYIRKSVEEMRNPAPPAGESEDVEEKASSVSDDTVEIEEKATAAPAPPVKEKAATVEPKPKRRSAWFGDLD